jgi:O6-methylguanine-DNA--protein-cysteine methyltransferase
MGWIESHRFSKERIMKLFLSHLDSPLGAMLLVTDAQQVVRALDFADHKARLHRGLREHYGEVELTEIPAPAGIADALARYFAGELEALNACRRQRPVPMCSAGSGPRSAVSRQVPP